jgi:hypothetical protein
MINELKRLIKEELDQATIPDVFYHGTAAVFPFQHFDPRSAGTGIVNPSRQKFGGFFFTSEKDNAEFYTEWFIATVRIQNILPSPIETNHPPTVLQQAVKDGKNYIVNDTLDGYVHSDIVVVPNQNVKDVTIVSWEFVGDKESYFDTLDSFFGHEDLDDINQDNIRSLLSMIEVNPSYVLSIPVFREYYESK